MSSAVSSSSSSPPADPAELARRELRRRAAEVELARRDPLYLVSQMVGVDQGSGERFDFRHIRAQVAPGEVELQGNTLVARDKNWRWQRWVAERVLADPRLIVLKGRQIGVTWIVLACDVAEALLQPGTASLLYRQREEDAIDNIRRWWTLYQSLPSHFKEGIKVLQPDLARTERPGKEGVALKFPSGEVSEARPMTSASSSGHGRTVRRVILDEAAHIENLAEIRAAVEPAAGRRFITTISTANGRSNQETGEGNEFHRLWVDPNSGYTRLFLPYDVHPERDAEWYQRAPEVQSLQMHLRQQNYPRDEHEAFKLSDRGYFDAEVLASYAKLVRLPEYRFDFIDRDSRNLAKHGEAVVHRHEQGLFRLYEAPVRGRKYAVGADVATGRGADYSAAYVVDLSSMALVAEFLGKIDPDLFAAQLHYLGKWFNDALLAVENNSTGEAVIIPLRDGRAGRPPYPHLYRHILSSRPDLPTAKPYGFPTNQKTRPLILSQLEQALRERSLPYVSNDLLFQMEEFVHHDSGTTPRARDGSHDDCVIAAAIALEMYRLRGEHANVHKPAVKSRARIGLGRKKRQTTVDLSRYAKGA